MPRGGLGTLGRSSLIGRVPLPKTFQRKTLMILLEATERSLLKGRLVRWRSSGAFNAHAVVPAAVRECQFCISPLSPPVSPCQVLMAADP